MGRQAREKKRKPEGKKRRGYINIEIYYIVSQPYRLSQELLDRILVARLSIDPNESNDEYPEDVRNDLKVLDFDYLLACWKRAHDIKRNTLTRSRVCIPFFFLYISGRSTSKKKREEGGRKKGFQNNKQDKSFQ